jgi:adenylate cyclase
MSLHLNSMVQNSNISSKISWWIIALCSVLITTALSWKKIPLDVYSGDEFFRDKITLLRASDEPEKRLAIVDIDEESLATLGPWPWPRTRIVDVVERLISIYGVRGVALDFFFPEAADIEGDQRLALLAQHGPLVMAQVFDYGNAPLKVGTLLGGESVQQFQPGSQFKIASGYIGNHAGLRFASNVGNIGFVPDADGVLRHLPPLTFYDGKVYQGLTSMLFNCCAAGATSAKPNNSNKRENAEALLSTQIDSKGLLRVPYRRKLDAFTVVKASDIMNDNLPPELLRGRLIILGSSSLNLSDRVATPLAPSTSGFLVHASMLSGILDAHDKSAPAAWPGRFLATIFSIIFASVAAYTFPRFSAVSNIALLAVATILWLLLAYLITPHDDFFSPSAPIISNLFLLTIAVPFGWQVSQRRSQRLLGTLQQYVAKAVVDELLRSDLKDPLAPRQLNVTTLIADMEAYTKHVENLPVEGAAKLTREFLECLTEPVLSLGGTLDKYTGDGLVAFWGAPLPLDNHADLALDAGKMILENVVKYNETRAKLRLPPVRVRIGVESGLAMAGDFGTSFRSIYTAVGDSVNLASRLEDIARNYPENMIIGQGTVALATRHEFTLLGERTLKGKSQTSKLFALKINSKPVLAAQ